MGPYCPWLTLAITKLDFTNSATYTWQIYDPVIKLTNGMRETAKNELVIHSC